MLPSFEKPRKPSSNSSSVHSSTASNSIGSSPASYGVHSSAGSTANKAAAANSTAGAQPSDDSARSTPALPPTTAADGAYITPVVPRTSDGGAHTTLPVPRTGGNPAAVKSPWGHGEDTEQLAQLRLFMRSQQQRVHRRLDDLWPLNAASDHPGKVGGLSLR
jgi:hypothetical protein